MRVTSRSALRLCAYNIRRFALRNDRVWVYGPTGDTDLLVSGIEKHGIPFIAMYNEHSPLKWIEDDLFAHAVGLGHQLVDA